jgi:hypothetical protein
MRRLVTILAAFMLVLPSAAVAQSAGDEQYSDPFGQTDDQGGSDGQQAQAPEAEPAPAQSDSALGQSEPEIQPAGAPTLPATGLPAVLLAGSGALLLAGGGTLRRLAS